MKERVAYDDAVDLLDADHKAVKKMFIDHAALCEDGAPAAAKRQLAQRICQALAVHAQIEEEVFYPQVRKAIGDDALMDEALHEHAEVKEAITLIEAMKATDAGHDVAVMQLGMLIDQHVLEERQLIFLKARQAALDLRGMTLPLLKRQQQLKKKAGATVAREEPCDGVGVVIDNQDADRTRKARGRLPELARPGASPRSSRGSARSG